MFSLFTSRTREPSTRLYYLANAFQFYGVCIAAVMGVALIAMPFIAVKEKLSVLSYVPMITFVGLTAASAFFIGRALHRRQRWGGYLAGITLGTPLLRQLLSPERPILSVSGIALCTVALCVTVSVWNELGTLRDADFDEDEEDELPTRNRGFGEARRSLHDSVPDSFAVQSTSTTEPVIQDSTKVRDDVADITQKG